MFNTTLTQHTECVHAAYRFVILHVENPFPLPLRGGGGGDCYSKCTFYFGRVLSNFEAVLIFARPSHNKIT